LDEIIPLIHSLEGIAIASHIDREAFSLIGQLGFIPENLDLDALEISPRISLEEAIKNFPYDYPITCSSDAHYPEDIGKGFTDFLLEEGTVAEIRKALNNEEGRRIIR
jgi:PHP family Zn ribbon phosphoesterase